MSHRKRIYLAGAMGCYGEDLYPYTWRNKVKQFFTYHSDNFEIFSPIDYYNYQNINHKSEKEIMLYELNALQDSKIMLVNLKDLDKSIGTSDEILFAYLNRIPIIGFYENENLSEIHPWKIEQINRIETGKDALLNAMDYIVNYYTTNRWCV